MRRYVITAVGILLVMVGACVYLLYFLKLPDEPRLENTYVMVKIDEKPPYHYLAEGWSSHISTREYTIRERSNGKLEVFYVGVLPNPSDQRFYKWSWVGADYDYRIKSDNTIDLVLHLDEVLNIENKAKIKVEKEQLIFEYYFGTDLIYSATYAEQKTVVV